MNHNTLFYKGSLANRSSAARERKKLEDLASCTGSVILDYSDVYSLSGSYADELFGVFAAEHGIDALKTQVRIRNATPHVAKEIGLAIQNRVYAKAQVA